MKHANYLYNSFFTITNKNIYSLERLNFKPIYFHKMGDSQYRVGHLPLILGVLSQPHLAAYDGKWWGASGHVA